MSRSGWSWGTTTFDFNLDGSPDIYVANGNESYESAQDYCTTFWTHDIYAGDSRPDPTLDRFFKKLQGGGATGSSWNPFEKNVLFMNLDGEGFLNVSFLMGTASEADSRSVVSEDLDNDGRPDLLFISVDLLQFKKTLHVYQNLWPEDNNWIGVHLPDGEVSRPWELRSRSPPPTAHSWRLTSPAIQTFLNTRTGKFSGSVKRRKSIPSRCGGPMAAQPDRKSRGQSLPLDFSEELTGSHGRDVRAQVDSTELKLLCRTAERFAGGFRSMFSSGNYRLKP